MKSSPGKALLRIALLLLALCAFPLASARAESALPSARESAQGYIRQILYPGAAARDARLLGQRLTGANRALYDQLASKVRTVASGLVTSTTFTFYAPDIYGTDTLTAADLGVSSLWNGTSITEEAQAALDAYLDAEHVLEVLQADCPYELYWYDRTAVPYVKIPVFPCDASGVHIRNSMDVIIEISLPVAAEYAAGSYTVSGAYGTAVQQAKDNAQRIVSAAAGKSDREKLADYLRELCALASPGNVPAGTAYGNPWQPVWALDDDPSTCVLGEGYAKAFQYLCDLTSFSRGGISAVCVGGTLGAEGESGRHVWNIVTMEDGRNYLADVMSCDGGVGAPDLLFLAGYVGGNSTDGYLYRAGSADVLYTYDREVRNLFRAEELEMADGPYAAPTGTAPGASPSPAPSRTPGPAAAPTATPA